MLENRTKQNGEGQKPNNVVHARWFCKLPESHVFSVGTGQGDLEVCTDVEGSFQGKHSLVGSNDLSRLPPPYAHLSPVICDTCIDRHHMCVESKLPTPSLQQKERGQHGGPFG